MLEAEVGAAHVNRDDFVEQCDVLLLQRCDRALDAGVVEKHVDPSEAVQRGFHVALDVGFIADVGLRREHALAAAERLGRGVETRLVDVHQHH